MTKKIKDLTIIRISNDHISFDVVNATVGIGIDKRGHYVTINDKKIYGLSRVEIIVKNAELEVEVDE